MGLPNQIANRSTFNPRQRAARKCPNSCTKIKRLKRNNTSSRMNRTFNACILDYVAAATDGVEYIWTTLPGNHQLCGLEGVSPHHCSNGPELWRVGRSSVEPKLDL